MVGPGLEAPVWGPPVGPGVRGGGGGGLALSHTGDRVGTACAFDLRRMSDRVSNWITALVTLALGVTAVCTLPAGKALCVVVASVMAAYVVAVQFPRFQEALRG